MKRRKWKVTRLVVVVIMLVAPLCVALAANRLLSFQSPVANSAGPISIAYGHHHLNVTSIVEHRKFWLDALGGVPVKSDATQDVQFPGVLIRIRQQVPTGGTKGTTVNHIGFQVPDLRLMVEKIKAAGYPITTAVEVTSVKPEEVKDGIAYIPNQDARVSFTMGPDDTKVELFENTALTVPIAMHHVHFAAMQADPARNWYIQLFGAVPARRGSFDTAELHNASLRWGSAATAPLGTKGRVLDHIGFDVLHLKDFCQKLEAMGVKFDRPYAVSEGMATAFLTDPLGTYVELTERLSKF